MMKDSGDSEDGAGHAARGTRRARGIFSEIRQE